MRLVLRSRNYGVHKFVNQIDIRGYCDEYVINKLEGVDVKLTKNY